jgi:hypothetical protein
LTGFEYQWDHYGPYDRSIGDGLKELVREERIRHETLDYGNGNWGVQYQTTDDVGLPGFTAAEKAIVDYVIDKFRLLALGLLKKAAYETEPMQNARMHAAHGRPLDMGTVSRSPSNLIQGLSIEECWRGHEQLEGGKTVPLDSIHV